MEQACGIMSENKTTTHWISQQMRVYTKTNLITGLTWSMAHGIKQGMSIEPFRGMWNVLGNAGHACTAGNAVFPILSDAVKPNIALTCQ